MTGTGYITTSRPVCFSTDLPALRQFSEMQIALDEVGRFETMMREEPAKYWRSPELQQQFREAIGRATPETPAGGEPSEGAPAVRHPIGDPSPTRSKGERAIRLVL
jgi:hypothetical protein